MLEWAAATITLGDIITAIFFALSLAYFLVWFAASRVLDAVRRWWK